MADPCEPSEVTEDEHGRRRFLVLATGAAGACAVGAAALPAIVTLVAPAGRRTVRSDGAPVDVGSAEDFRPGAPRRVVVHAQQTDGWMTSEVELGAAWIVRREGGRLAAFSATCPHLGCGIDAGDEPGAPFTCPCHDSDFSLEGACLSGPSPRPLDALAVFEKDGRVQLEFRRFVVGSAEKVEV